MRVLLTRPADDSAASAARLVALDIDSVIAPLLEIVFDDAARLDLTGAQALLVTSANGAHALAHATDRRDLPVLAVGDASAAVVRAAGFDRVASADGDVGALVALVTARCAPGDGALVHAAASRTVGDLAGRLELGGFAVRRAVLYRARPVATLPAVARTALTDDAIDAVLLYSPRTAGAFVRLVCAAGLALACRPVAAVCLSANVADAVDRLDWRAVAVAAAPREGALFDRLQELATPVVTGGR